MPYVYDDLKPDLFTDSGQRTFLSIRDRATKLLDQAGALTVGKAIRSVCGDSWLMLACIDRLVELGEIREVFDPGVATQDKVYVRGARA